LEPTQEEGVSNDLHTYNSSVQRLYPGTAETSKANLSTTGLSPKQKRAVLEGDPSFKKEMNDTITNLKRMPQFKNKVWDKVTSLHQ